MGDSDFEEDKQNTFEISEDEQIHFTETHEANHPLQQTNLSEENLSRPSKDNRKEKPDREQRIIEKRPAEKEMVKRNGSKRQKITEKVLDIMQRNSAERSERQAKLLNAIETRNVEEDSIDMFFKSMAMSVKRLSHYSQIRAKMEICRIVGELELRELQQSSTNIMPVASQPASSFPPCSVYSTEDSASTYNSRYNFSAGCSNMSQQDSRPSTAFSTRSVTTPEVSPNTEAPQVDDYSSNSNATFFNLI